MFSLSFVRKYSFCGLIFVGGEPIFVDFVDIGEPLILCPMNNQFSIGVLCRFCQNYEFKYP